MLNKSKPPNSSLYEEPIEIVKNGNKNKQEKNNTVNASDTTTKKEMEDSKATTTHSFSSIFSGQNILHFFSSFLSSSKNRKSIKPNTYLNGTKELEQHPTYQHYKMQQQPRFFRHKQKSITPLAPDKHYNTLVYVTDDLTNGKSPQQLLDDIDQRKITENDPYVVRFSTIKPGKGFIYRLGYSSSSKKDTQFLSENLLVIKDKNRLKSMEVWNSKDKEWIRLPEAAKTKTEIECVQFEHDDDNHMTTIKLS